MKLPKEDVSDLMSKSNLIKKESKRTTFKLSRKSLEAIDWMVESYNLTAKEVFDQICSGDTVLEHAVEFVKKSEGVTSKEFTRKTFVISQQSLGLLNRTSNRQKISRDLLVNYLILLYKVLIEKNIEQEKKNEAKALKIISEFWKEAGDVEKQLTTLLGDENPIIMRFITISIIIGNLYDAIESKLSDGTPIDPDDM
jgi:hypothetical protein